MKNKLLQESLAIYSDLVLGRGSVQTGDKPILCIYGSARPEPGSDLYKDVMSITKEFVAKGYDIITGAGPGIMAAANQAAQEAGARSGGVGLATLTQEVPSDYLDDDFTYHAQYFSTRKMLQVDSADAFLIVPGGIGTLDELSEIMTLMTTKQIEVRPIWIYNRKGHYNHLITYLEHCVKVGTMSASDLELLTII